MEKLAFRGEAKSVEDKVKALQNLLVLCRESESGATGVWNNVSFAEKIETKKKFSQIKKKQNFQKLKNFEKI